jgi:hypothetical protein
VTPRHRIRRGLTLRLCGSALFLPLALLTPQQAAASAFVPAPGTLVFSDSFQKHDWGRHGAVWCPHTSAYPDGRTNPKDWKLDRITPRALTVVRGEGLEFRATPVTRRPAGQWATGLLTTEPWDGGSCGGNGFMVQAEDYVLVHLRLPGRAGGGGHGAWPSVWTWKNGDNEVDVLEWHSEAPDRAEFVNHAGGGAGQVRSRLLGYGRWVYVGARFGKRTVTWYLGDSPARMRAVFSDRRGVPSDWQAYLVVNLSVSAQAGRTPTALTPLTTVVSAVKVYRPVITGSDGSTRRPGRRR